MRQHISIKPILSISIFVSICFIFSCNNDLKVSDEVSKIALDLEIERFDKIFAESNEDDLPELKNVFPFLFSKRYHDSIWIKRMNDTLQIQLLEEIDKNLGAFAEETVDIELFYKHLKFH